jgi:GDP-mannose 6-dehydrogenase
MRISIFGMGYVGAVSGACLADMGHSVVGVDANSHKVDLINAAKAPIVEADIEKLIRSGVESGRLRATTDPEEAIAASDVSFVSVGTPSAANGSLSLGAIDAVIGQIGRAIRRKREGHAVVVRSTVLPGTTEERIAPRLIEASGRRIGDGLELCFNPEFLREGSSVSDFREPPMTVVGSIGAAGYAVLDEVYRGVDADPIHTSCRVAESVKYLGNLFHAVKIAFANEVGALLKGSGVDAREAMRIFCRDTRLNISTSYLRPGFAFGGSCLPKDLRAFLARANTLDIDLPFLGKVLVSNETHIERAFRIIAARGRKKVALFGLAFKHGTDDLRESPLVALAERLIGKGYELTVFDQDVETARLIGANRDFIDREIPHFERLLAPSAREALNGAEIIVIGHARAADLAVVAEHARGRMIVDLAGIEELRRLDGVDYEGICW